MREQLGLLLGRIGGRERGGTTYQASGGGSSSGSSGRVGFSRRDRSHRGASAGQKRGMSGGVGSSGSGSRQSGPELKPGISRGQLHPDSTDALSDTSAYLQQSQPHGGHLGASVPRSGPAEPTTTTSSAAGSWWRARSLRSYVTVPTPRSAAMGPRRAGTLDV